MSSPENGSTLQRRLIIRGEQPVDTTDPKEIEKRLGRSFSEDEIREVFQDADVETIPMECIATQPSLPNAEMHKIIVDPKYAEIDVYAPSAQARFQSQLTFSLDMRVKEATKRNEDDPTLPTKAHFIKERRIFRWIKVTMPTDAEHPESWIFLVEVSWIQPLDQEISYRDPEVIEKVRRKLWQIQHPPAPPPHFLKST